MRHTSNGTASLFDTSESCITYIRAQ